MHPNRSQQFVCHFVEKDGDNFANMRAAVVKHRAVASGRIACHFYHQPFADASRNIIAAIRAADQPSFFFVDPFGYAEDVPMTVLGDVLKLPKAELFVNLMFMFINRALTGGNAALAPTLDNLMGSPDWRSLGFLHGHGREQGFITLYRNQLKQRGAEFVIPFRMGDDDCARTLYYLVHATKHIKGANVMKRAMVASGSRGELGYSGQMRHRMSPLFNLDTKNLPDYLLQRFGGQTVTFSSIIAQTIEETGTCLESA